MEHFIIIYLYTTGGEYYWIGLSDLQEGKWRWSYDQSDVTFTIWVSRCGHRGTSYNCVTYKKKLNLKIIT